MAYGKKTGGRQKGTPNKQVRQRFKLIEIGLETPLEYMLRVMNDPSATRFRRDEMAKAAAPYVHARQTALRVGDNNGDPLAFNVTFAPAELHHNGNGNKPQAGTNGVSFHFGGSEG